MWFLKALLLIDQSTCYKFNVAKTHCGTCANCQPNTRSNQVTVDNLWTFPPLEHQMTLVSKTFKTGANYWYNTGSNPVTVDN